MLHVATFEEQPFSYDPADYARWGERDSPLVGELSRDVSQRELTVSLPAYTTRRSLKRTKRGTFGNHGLLSRTTSTGCEPRNGSEGSAESDAVGISTLSVAVRHVLRPEA